MMPLDQARAQSSRAERHSGTSHLDRSSGIAIARNDGFRLGPCSVSPKAALAALRDYSGRSAFPLRAARDDGRLTPAFTKLPAEEGAVFLANADPAQAHRPQQMLRNLPGVPVVTDQETSAVALTAALLTSVNRTGLRPGASRVVLVEADTLPILRPLLAAAGFVGLAQWSQADSGDVPLKALAHGASAIVDLTGDGRGTAAVEDAEPDCAVISPDDPLGLLLPVPGLMRSVLDFPATLTASDLSVRSELYCACAYALAAAAPPDGLLPELADPAVPRNVAQAANAVLRHL
jgi:hypothetical protein